MTDFTKLFPDNRTAGETPLRQAQLVMLRMLKIIDHICQEHGFSYWLCSGTLLGAVRHKGFIPWDDDLDICMMREDYEKFVEIAQKEFQDDMFIQTRETDPTYDYLALPCKIRDKKSLIISEGMENNKYQQGLFIDIFPADRFHSKGFALFREKLSKRYFRLITKGLDAELGKARSSKNKAIAYLKPIFRYLTIGYLKRANKKISKNKSLGTDCLIGHGFDTPWQRYFKYDEILPLKKLQFEDAFFMVPNNADVYLTDLYGKDYMTPPPMEQRVQKHAVILKPILK